jgi:hypothetical protein
MRRVIQGLAVSVVAVLANPAQAAPDTMVTGFTVENVSAALKDLGATDIQTYDAPGGNKGVKGTVEGYMLHLSIQHCSEPAGCEGLLIGAAFSTDGRNVPAEALLSFTQKYPPTPALRLGSGGTSGVALVRAVVATGGISTANMQRNIVMVPGTIPAFTKHVNETTIASNMPGTTMLTGSNARLRQIPLSPAQMQEWALPLFK